jgi:hypothetical protein
MMDNFFIMEIVFRSDRPLKELSAQCSQIFETQFIETDQFDEVPGHIAKIGEVELALMKAPDEHPTRESTLSISARTDLEIEDYVATLPAIFREIFVSKPVNSRGFIECSEELQNAFLARGFSDCISCLLYDIKYDE